MTTELNAVAYAGARVTRLIGRQDVLEEIETAVRKRTGSTHLFYITARGGTGKTFLAREVLRRCGASEESGKWAAGDLLAVEQEVDLYHHKTHSPEGFMAAVVEALGEEGKGFFADYYARRNELEAIKPELHGAVGVLGEYRERMTEAFLSGCEALGEQKRVVIVLDTTEKLVYETDRVQEAVEQRRATLDLSAREFGLRPWLLKTWLPTMGNAVILICGRPRPRFAADLEAAAGDLPKTECEALELSDFQEADTLEYFRAVEETAARDGNARALERLKAVSLDARQAIHDLSGGRPIVLALMIDNYLVTGRFPEEVRAALATMPPPGDEEPGRERDPILAAGELEAKREQVLAGIVRQFLEGWRPADEAIRALAWAKKGLDAELLSRIAEMDEGEAGKMLRALADPRQGLSFVKIRPSGDRAFLHDEMYALMKTHLRDQVPALSEEIYGVIQDYYADKIEAEKTTVAKLRKQVREEWERQKREEWRKREREERLEQGVFERPASHRSMLELSSRREAVDSRELALALARLNDLRVEDVYYKLQADPLTGFQDYCEYAEEAVTSNDAELDMQLRDELLAFLREDFGDQAEVGGLRRVDVELYAAIRWVWRNVYGGRPRRAKRIAEFLRTDMPEFVDEGGALSWTELDIAEAWAEAHLGGQERLEAAEKRLREASARLPQLDLPPMFWARRAVLRARSYNVLGYVLRVQGRFRAACQAYRPALPLWQELERDLDRTETLNNLAWSSAEAGEFGRALRHARDGLEFREAMGYHYLIALSANTLGLVEVRADQPHWGRVHCERALDIFSELGVDRGVGLACTGLAEAYRCCAEARGVYLDEEKIELLRKAEGYARAAVEIFQDKVPEQLREVEALIELGCTYRDWARVAPVDPDEGDLGRAELIQLGAKTLQHAADLAADGLPYRQVDALVNLAWLHYYTSEPEKALQVLANAEAWVPQEYRFSLEEGQPIVEEPVAFLWVQLGKGHMLRGKIALDRYQALPLAGGQVRDPELWRKVANHFALALAYDEQFGDKFRDMRRAKDMIYDSLRRINVEEVKAMYAAVERISKAYRLDCQPATVKVPSRPRMRDFLEEYFGPERDYEAPWHESSYPTRW